MKNKSPYSAALTGCSFAFNEFKLILPLLMQEDSAALLKGEKVNNNLLQVNAEESRKKFLAEFKRRYDAVPASFWEAFQNMSEAGQRAGLLYAILRAYKLVFDFHFNVTLKRWNSIEQVVTKNDIMMEFSEIGAKDEFVDGWTENTKGKCASQYLNFIREAGLLDKRTSELHALHLDATDFEYYIRTGDEWFLEACLLLPYEINDIKACLR